MSLNHPADPNHPYDAVTVQGKQGKKILNVTHDDIGESHVNIFVHSGSIHAVFEQRNWYKWEPRKEWQVDGGEQIEEYIYGSSFNCDHRLQVTATGEGLSRADIVFSSHDF